MKKNILAIIILAATIVNVVLTAVMLFTIIPKAQRTDALIQKIVTILDLELENPDAADYATVPVEDRDIYKLADEITVNLAKAENDTKSAYARVEVSLVLNKKSDSYETIQPLLVNYESIIRSIVSDEVSKYTANELGDNKKLMEKSILERLRTEFESVDLVAGVNLVLTYERR